MSYPKDQRVRHVHGMPGTVTRNAADDAPVWVRWDDTSEEVQVLPECITPLDQKQVTSTSVRDAWARKTGAR